jgi:hypothetical protein
VIPEFVKYPNNEKVYIVSGFRDNIFMYNTGLSGSLTFPKSIKHVERYAFADCDNLTSIRIQDSTETNDIDLGDNAFADCNNLQTIDFSNANNFVSIDKYSFEGCNSLTTAKFGNLYKYAPTGMSVGEGAFTGCENLLTFSTTMIHNDVAIGDQAF